MLCHVGIYLLKEKGTRHGATKLESGQGRAWEAADSPLCSEVHKLGRETVSWELGRWLFHHLLQLLERSPPGFVRKAQDGHLDLPGGRNAGQRRTHLAPGGRPCGEPGEPGLACRSKLGHRRVEGWMHDIRTKIKAGGTAVVGSSDPVGTDYGSRSKSSPGW